MIARNCGARRSMAAPMTTTTFASPPLAVAPRPALPRTLGIILIVLSSLALAASFADLADPSGTALRDSETAAYFAMLTRIETVSGLVLGALALLAGIQLARYRRSGVRAAIAFAVMRLVSTLALTVAVLARLLDAPRFRPEMLGAVIGSALPGIVVPIVVLALVGRRSVRDACAA